MSSFVIGAVILMCRIVALIRKAMKITANAFYFAPEAFTTCGSIAAYEYHIGMHLTMEHYRHKTQHWQFRLAVILSAVIFLVVLPVIFFLRMSE